MILSAANNVDPFTMSSTFLQSGHLSSSGMTTQSLYFFFLLRLAQTLISLVTIQLIIIISPAHSRHAPEVVASAEQESHNHYPLPTEADLGLQPRAHVAQHGDVLGVSREVPRHILCPTQNETLSSETKASQRPALSHTALRGW